MNAPSLLTRRAASICFSCRRNLLRQRQFSTSPCSLVAAFQAYTLPSRPPPTARNASVPDTSIATPIETPAMPKIHETRPPPKQGAPPETADKSIPEREAQQSKAGFAATPTSEPTSSPNSSPQPSPTSAPSSATAGAGAGTGTAAKPSARPRSRLRARKAAITLTPAAVEHLRALLDQPEPKLIKVGVRNRGCSGLAYHLEYVEKPGAFDETVEQDGVKVLIDSKALFSIIGSEMDWVEDKLSQRFVFRNPNIKEQCGCGESFMV
ncbi:hypothetical protein MYCTH_2313065 [Thermothelomyces thermophilus ATCC 42464]|uniref:Iron-sulfur assembly protein 1 n=1 Tax=Thermothelomyces thermophilus (strain ATCC 42464 / BCRC 31852 / DSM 1799) TaxID=573729 RepID=G2QNM0_THET4|nr:uncharacterized protein MYCTH_2313065 [Thermothelomyces thermophilus ATCC 42464]AEO62093.1 hypothetical protein MYCTH_2313065 [Thermothelomyces thermophilus ATCC 42464]